MKVLTAIDVVGIQRYVFGSNRLRDIMSRSRMVDWATSCRQRDAALDGCSGDVLSAAGGNALILFESLQAAQAFAAKYSRKLWETVPALDYALVHREFEDGKLAEALKAIFVDLAVAKARLPVPGGRGGLGITVACPHSGMPAVAMDRTDQTPISVDIQSGRSRLQEARSAWNHLISKQQDYCFPDEFDDMGRSVGDTSLLGIVHVDGNGVGNKIVKWLDECISGRKADADLISEFREWSGALSAVATDAFRRVCQLVESNIIKKNDQSIIGGQVKQLEFTLARVDSQTFLPVRPIVIGGDDITFVCDGRLALSLVAESLKAFQGTVIPHLGSIGASAGIAFARTHAPIAQAYELACDLCSSAKRALNERKRPDGNCALDWHIGGIPHGASIEELRERVYTKPSWKLTCRPYELNADENRQTHSWERFSEAILGADGGTGFRGVEWSKRRNKVKAMRDAVAMGDLEELKVIVRQIQVIDGSLKLPASISEGDNPTPLLDAIELLDIHQILKPAQY